MKKVLFSLLVLGATTAAMADGAAIFTKCQACHGAKAEKNHMGNQVIQGWDAAKIEAALNGYKDGTYGAAKKGLMQAQVKNLSADDIKAVSAYIATLK